MVNNRDKPEATKVPVLFAEDLPQDKDVITVLMSNCHKIRSLHIQWDCNERVLSMLCSECGRPVHGIKVEKRGSIIRV